jgi:hypothetical protein
MDGPRLEVGDVFRRYGETYRQQHAGSLSRDQLRVMTAIERCRTAAWAATSNNAISATSNALLITAAATGIAQNVSP